MPEGSFSRGVLIKVLTSRWVALLTNHWKSTKRSLLRRLVHSLIIFKQNARLINWGHSTCDLPKHVLSWIWIIDGLLALNYSLPHVLQRSLHVKIFTVSRLTTAPEKCKRKSMMEIQTWQKIHIQIKLIKNLETFSTCNKFWR